MLEQEVMPKTVFFEFMKELGLSKAIITKRGWIIINNSTLLFTLPMKIKKMESPSEEEKKFLDNLVIILNRSRRHNSFNFTVNAFIELFNLGIGALIVTIEYKRIEIYKNRNEMNISVKIIFGLQLMQEMYTSIKNTITKKFFYYVEKPVALFSYLNQIKFLPACMDTIGLFSLSSRYFTEEDEIKSEEANSLVSSILLSYDGYFNVPNPEMPEQETPLFY